MKKKQIIHFLFVLFFLPDFVIAQDISSSNKRMTSDTLNDTLEQIKFIINEDRTYIKAIRNDNLLLWSSKPQIDVRDKLIFQGDSNHISPNLQIVKFDLFETKINNKIIKGIRLIYSDNYFIFRDKKTGKLLQSWRN